MEDTRIGYCSDLPLRWGMNFSVLFLESFLSLGDFDGGGLLC